MASTSSVAQGKRPQTPYTPSDRATLLDDEGALTDKLVDVLEAIFLKYAIASQSGETDSKNGGADSKVLDSKGLERFGIDTNGSPMPEDQIEELRNFLDCDEQQNLTFKGFIQMYQLQTENDEEETWRDLKAHGYDDSLELVSTRKEDQDGATDDNPSDSNLKHQADLLKDDPETANEVAKEAGV